MIGVSATSALVIGGLLLRNHTLAKKAKLNADVVKTKLKTAIQKLKDTTTSKNGGDVAKNRANKLLDSVFVADILDILTDVAIWA